MAEYTGPRYLLHPMTALICGPTSCGKTWLVKNLIMEKVINQPPEKTYWFYGEAQPKLFAQMKDVEFVQGFSPEIYDSIDGNQRTLIIIDDLMDEVSNDKTLASIYTRGSHHKNISVVTIVQNLFPRGRQFRNISLNCHYIIVFKSARDRNQIKTLAQQAGIKLEVDYAFKDATKEAYGYLLLDFKPQTDDRWRLRTRILPSDKYHIVYRPTH